jgi:glucose-1-phosphate cytidylyltransferase
MKVVLMAGGAGLRLMEETRKRPKPLVTIGDMPVIWHIMKTYSSFGHNEFVICAGYRQDMIKRWFSDYFLTRSDVTFDLTGSEPALEVHASRCEPWRVTVVDTGRTTLTGARLAAVRDYVDGETFMLTYADGVSDIDLDALVARHRAAGRVATITCVRRPQSKGLIDLSADGLVSEFREKSHADDDPINAGYMVLEPEVFDYLGDDSGPLERGPMGRLAAAGQLAAYEHDGFWQCMDTLQERTYLDELVREGRAPWIRWD